MTVWTGPHFTVPSCSSSVAKPWSHCDSSLVYSQLSPNRAQRVDLPGRYGTIAALRAPAVGDDALRTTALLVPGYTGSKEDFAPIIDPIADAGFEVLALDLPGQQDSPGPDDEALYRPGPLGSVLAELIGKIAADGRRVLLLGHSYGGLVVRAAVFAGAPIAGLTLIRRLTLIAGRDGRIRTCFYPVFPPDADAQHVLDHLART